MMSVACSRQPRDRPAHGLLIRLVEPVERPRVEQQPVSAADCRLAQPGDVTADEPHLDTRRGCALIGPPQCLRHQLHTGDFPTPLGQLDCPGAAAGAEIQRGTVRRST